MADVYCYAYIIDNSKLSLKKERLSTGALIMDKKHWKYGQKHKKIDKIKKKDYVRKKILVKNILRMHCIFSYR